MTLCLTVTGQVQGVGFRPFIYRLARKLGLKGQVRNTAQGVQIRVQGPIDLLQDLPQRIRSGLPPLAAIRDMQATWVQDIAWMSGFRIEHSTPGTGHSVLISPDIAPCAHCLQEMHDPSDPRYLYPFTNCTNCGPRYTITTAIPYDRATTSMACFPLCAQCRQEYEDPGNRRFHAQPNACPQCGPLLWAASAQGQTLARQNQALDLVARHLLAGKIVALKGMGGFHLACLATQADVVHRLRQRKQRPSKALAVMVPDTNTAERLATVSAQDREWLQGMIRPILICTRHTQSLLPENIAPDTTSLGLMLPSTPLHEVLFAHLTSLTPPGSVPALVMTSGNLSDHPIVLGNRQALRDLQGIADTFLLHNRDILVRCDDSVLRTLPRRKAPVLFRRARGFTPSPIDLPASGPCVLGVGPEQKNTICLTKGAQAFVSQHIGDLHNLETLAFFEQSISHLQGILQVRPQALITDLHPDFMSTRFAREQTPLSTHALQHHLAHIYAVLAENQEDGPCLGLALDGTGLGLDQTLWGGELLSVHPAALEHKRLGHFTPVPLPGGDVTVREPWRVAQSYLFTLGVLRPQTKNWPWLADNARASEIVGQMLTKSLRCIPSSSCGRLFDAVAAMLGLCTHSEYEGQAAIRLEAVQDPKEGYAYACPLREQENQILLDSHALFAQVYQDWLKDLPSPRISRRFHLGLCQGLCAWALALAEQTGLQRVALSGGVLQNLTLSRRLADLLQDQGLSPLVHQSLPPNDACISLGQAFYGQTLLRLNS